MSIAIHSELDELASRTSSLAPVSGPCIIAGSRTICSLELLEAIWRKALLAGFHLPSQVICGCAGGVDQLGFGWARAQRIPVEFFPAWPNQSQWAHQNAILDETVHPLPIGCLSRRAGFVRNGLMVEFALSQKGSALMMWDGISHGSRDTIFRARRAGLALWVEVIPPEGPLATWALSPEEIDDLALIPKPQRTPIK